MKISKGPIVLFLVFLLFLSSCSTVPITGRKQFSIVPSSRMLSMSLKQYDEFLGTHTLSKNNSQTQLVNKVGKRIQKAVEKYFAEQGKSYELQDYEWDFNLQESEADYLGLVFMTIAGYDPNEAVGLWQRMAENKKGQAPPEFMSTHPSDQTRIRKISEAIPEVLKNYG